VRSTNSGVSAFVDPVGRVISNTKTFQEEAQRATLRWLKGKTLYTFWGDAPWWLVSIASFVFAFRRRDKSQVVTATPAQEPTGEANAQPAPANPADSET
jgi:apolipoprotein N-acyltransferase